MANVYEYSTCHVNKWTLCKTVVSPHIFFHVVVSRHTRTKQTKNRNKNEKKSPNLNGRHFDLRFMYISNAYALRRGAYNPDWWILYSRYYLQHHQQHPSTRSLSEEERLILAWSYYFPNNIFHLVANSSATSSRNQLQKTKTVTEPKQHTTTTVRVQK